MTLERTGMACKINICRSAGENWRGNVKVTRLAIRMRQIREATSKATEIIHLVYRRSLRRSDKEDDVLSSPEKLSY